MKIEKKIVEIVKPQIELSDDEIINLKETVEILKQIIYQVRDYDGSGVKTKYKTYFTYQLSDTIDLIEAVKLEKNVLIEK